MDLKGKKVLVVGAGKSGISTADFLVRHGAEVILTDKKAPGLLLPELAALDARVKIAAGAYPDARGFDLVVTSPGVPRREPVLDSADRAGIAVIGELELSYRFCRSPILAITGTNGKTTTTALAGQICGFFYKHPVVGGNIGVPLISLIESAGEDDPVIAEVSSFQLETVDLFRPKVAVILNITPDHLDRHGDMDGYTKAKARILERQTKEDAGVLNYDDPLVRSLSDKCRGQVIFFSTRHNLEKGVFIKNNRVVFRRDGREEDILGVGEIRLPGEHNVSNVLAAVAATRMLGVEPEAIARGVANFRGVPHRLETVLESGGVLYINDSKGTNPDAAITALKSFKEPLVLIAGGRNKGSDFTAFAEELVKRVRVLILLGEAAGEIEAAVKKLGFDAVKRTSGLEEAVKTAVLSTRPGDVVLLSPACASWDMFRNYEERGERFSALVKELVHSF